MARTSRATTISSQQLTLIHVPTGIEVTGQIAEGSYSRKDTQRLLRALNEQLFGELALKVAQAPRLPGNPRHANSRRTV